MEPSPQCLRSINLAASVQEKAAALSRAYHPSYGPPRWSLAMVGSDKWLSLAAEAEVLTFDPRAKLVQLVAERREPVNIGMQPCFYSDVMQEAFGYRVSGYSTAFKQDDSTLPPNLAVYLRTPMVSANGPVVHVINAVGFAFDDEDQPDYRYLITGRRDRELLGRLTTVFLLVFACAKRKSLSTVVLSLLGGGAFSELFPGGPERYIYEYYMPALRGALAQLPSSARPSRLGMMGMPSKGVMALLREVSGGIPCQALGFIPSICTDGGLPADSLLMNAWDPHSVVGNGNGADNSLDGFFGRSSAMAYLSFPLVNSGITYVPADELESAIAGADVANNGPQ